MKKTLLALSAAVLTLGSVQAGVTWTFDSLSSVVNSGRRIKPDGTDGNSSTPAPYLEASSKVKGVAGFSGNALATEKNGTFDYTFVTSAAAPTFSVTYRYNSAATGGATSDAWQISVNGGAFSTAQTVTKINNGTWQTATVTFTAPAASGSTVVFRDIQSGQTVDYATAYDNVQLSEVPEPTSIALAIFAAGGIGIATGRRFLSKKSAPRL